MQQYAAERLWIACNKDKSPYIGTSIDPRFTFDEVPAGYLKGFVFRESEGLVGIDLDNCITQEGFTELASTILEAVPSDAYVEYSMSGKGIHIIGKMSTTLDDWKNTKFVEMYNKGRFFIITGKLHPGFQGHIVDLTSTVNTIKALHPPASPRISSEEYAGTQADLSRVKAALETLSPDCSYEEWMRLGMAIGNSFKNTELRKDAAKLFAKWSARSVKFDEKAVASIHDYFDPQRSAGGLTLATVFHAAPIVMQREKLALLSDNVPEMPSLVSTGATEIPEEAVPQYSYKLHPNKVAEEFISKRRCFTKNGKKFTLWSGDRWAVNEEVFYLAGCIERFIFEQRYNWIMVGKGENRQAQAVSVLKTSDLNEVVEHVIRQCGLRHAENPKANTWFDVARRREEPYVIAVKNGLLSIKQGKVISPHTVEFYNTGVLPCAWNEHAKCPKFLAGLHLTFAGEQSEEAIQDNIDCLQLWFGYLFLVGYSEKKLCVLLGDSNSGKSTLLRIMEILVGQEYYKALSLKDLDGTRTDSAVGFDTNLLGGFDEFPFDKRLGGVPDMIKMYTGDTKISQRGLHKEGVTVEMLMKLCITSNASPVFLSDPMGGLMNRFLIWSCKAVPKEKIDPGYLRYLENHELEGILLWAVRGAQRLLSGERLRQAGGESGDLYNAFRESTRTYLELWVEDVFEEDEKSIVTNAELFERIMSDRLKLDYRPMARWLDEHNLTRKALISLIQKAIRNTVFPNSVLYKKDGLRGVRGIRPRK